MASVVVDHEYRLLAPLHDVVSTEWDSQQAQHACRAAWAQRMGWGEAG